MSDMRRLRYRMYIFLVSGLSEEQKTLQTSKAILKYALKYKNDVSLEIFEFYNSDDYFLIDGGSSNDGHLGNRDGDMQLLIKQLDSICAKYVKVYETNLNSILSAICLLLDERVWDLYSYPDFKNYVIQKADPLDVKDEINIRMSDDDTLIEKFDMLFSSWKQTICDRENDENITLRKILKKYNVL